MSNTETQKPTGAGYSKTYAGEIGTDGVHRDWNGNVIPVGLDEDTKAELQRQIDGPRVRLIASDNDRLSGNVSTGGVENPTYVDPNESDDAYAKAFRPGYAIESAGDDGKTAAQRTTESDAAAKAADKGEAVITTSQPTE